MADHSIDPDLLRRYLDDACTPEEAARVEEWYHQTRHDGTPPEFSQRRHLLKVRRKIVAIEAARENLQHAYRVSQRTTWKRYVAAASLLLLIGTALSVGWLRKDHPGTSKNPTEMATVFSNTLARIVKYQLPDQSVVWLHPGATLGYEASSFSTVSRKVQLHGEAFFDVAKKPDNPFIVEVDKMRVKVLGTSFLIRPADNQTDYVVAVVSGKVEISSTGGDSEAHAPSVVLHPSEKASFHLPSGSVTASRITTADAHIDSWQPASLSFEDASLGEVAGELERKFGVTIVLENNALSNCILKASFENHQLAEILDALSEMLELTYEIDQKQIILQGKGCGTIP